MTGVEVDKVQVNLVAGEMTTIIDSEKDIMPHEDGIDCMDSMFQ
jgi:hypothetical protein